jgi:hypothetical protein
VAHLAWTKGGEAELAAIDGDRVRLRSSSPSAPGSRIEGSLLASGTAIRLKVARCRLQECGGRTNSRDDVTKADRFYELDGRLIDATREVRAELARLVAGERVD